MRISFLGAARNVTGSMHLLNVNGSNILLECGLFQGRRQEAFERNRDLPFDASLIDVMVLSHAHIDHSGNIPNLVRSGFAGNIYTTFATRDLCSIMLRDAAYIMESDVRYLNKHRRRQNKPLVKPTYTIEDATRSLHQFVSIDYGRETWIGPNVKLTFYDAGHILGSAIVALDITEGKRQYRLVFTGDLGRYEMPILRDPQVVPGADYLITESTYGNRLHGTPQDAEGALKRIINETYARRGKVIIPAFSVGRTQEIVYSLHLLHNRGEVPELPIFVDSPLSVNATEVFRLHPEYYDQEAYELMIQDRDPFGFGRLRYLRRVEDSKALNDRDEPMIIISASGMCEAGRILHHIKNNVEDSRNTLLFVGYQAEHTLGRRILEGRDELHILGGTYRLRARVERIDGYSAHADREELLAYAQQLDPDRLKRVFVVHGDEDSALALADGLTELGVRQATVPHLGEKIHI